MSETYGLDGTGIAMREIGREGMGHRESVADGVRSSSRLVSVAWDQRKNAAAYLTGFAYRQGDRLKRWLPGRDPNDETLFCVRATVLRGVDGQGKQYTPLGRTSNYKYAEMELEYQTRRMRIRHDLDPLVDDVTGPHEYWRYVEFDVDPNVTYLSYPAGILYYRQNPSVSFPGSVGRTEVSADLVFTWRQVPRSCVDLDRNLSYLGKVNRAAIAGFGPHKLLLLKMVPRYTEWYIPVGYGTDDPTRGQGWDITFNFKYLPDAKHTQILDFKQVPPVYVQVSTEQGITPLLDDTTDGKLIYDNRDFELLFRPPTSVLTTFP